MQTTLLLVQFMCKPVALFCCALFAGASAYISFVEDPTITDGGRDLIGSYLMFAKPRPAVFQTLFATLGFLAGTAAGIAGAGFWWVSGGLLMGLCGVVHVSIVLPQTRRLLDVDLGGDQAVVSGSTTKLARLHAAQTIAALASLCAFILAF